GRGEGVASPIGGGEGVIGRQRRMTVRAGEMHGAAVAGSLVVVGAEGADREAERCAGRGAGRGSEGEVAGGRGPVGSIAEGVDRRAVDGGDVREFVAVEISRDRQDAVDARVLTDGTDGECAVAVAKQHITGPSLYI